MNDISDILRSLLDRYVLPSDADREFARMLADDKELKADYADWCVANGYDEKTGYGDFLDEIIEARDSIWENLNE